MFKLPEVPLINDIEFHERKIEYDWKKKRKEIADEVRLHCLPNSTINKNKRKNKRVSRKRNKRR